MPRLTEPKKSVDLFEQSYDYDYYLGLWLDMQRAWGTPPEMMDVLSTGGGRPMEQPYDDLIVRFPDTRPVTFEEGRSPFLMTNTNIVVSRVAAKEPVYTLKDIPATDAEVRKQLLLARMRDDTNGTDWYEERQKAFADGYGFGVGAMELGLEENRYSGEDMLTAQHVPVLQHFWDWWSPSPIKSDWAASVFYLAPHVAAKLFGWKAVKDHIKKDPHTSETGQPAEYVRIMRRFDTGYGPKGDPTFTVWIGSYKNAPVINEYNTFERNPHAYAVGRTMSGMSRPVGNIFESRADAEALHALLVRIRETAENGGEIDVLYEQGLDPDDLERVQQGRQRFVKATSAMDKQPFYRIAAQTVGSDLWQLVQYYHQRFGVSGNIADIDTATRSGGEATATQIAEEANRLNMNMGRTTAMMVKFQEREVECSRVVAKAGDRHPTRLNVFKSPILVNQPGQPESWLSEWMNDPASIESDTKAMTVAEDRLQQAFQLTFIEKLIELGTKIDPQGQMIDYRELLEDYIEAGGKDPEKLILKAGSAPMVVPPNQAPGPLNQPMPLAMPA